MSWFKAKEEFVLVAHSPKPPTPVYLYCIKKITEPFEQIVTGTHFDLFGDALVIFDGEDGNSRAVWAFPRGSWLSIEDLGVKLDD